MDPHDRGPGCRSFQMKSTMHSFLETTGCSSVSQWSILQFVPLKMGRLTPSKTRYDLYPSNPRYFHSRVLLQIYLINYMKRRPQGPSQFSESQSPHLLHHSSPQRTDLLGARRDCAVSREYGSLYRRTRHHLRMSSIESLSFGPGPKLDVQGLYRPLGFQLPPFQRWLRWVPGGLCGRSVLSPIWLEPKRKTLPYTRSFRWFLNTP